MAKKKRPSIPNQQSISRFFPKKKPTKHAAAPLDSKIHKLMESEMRRESIGWREFLDAACRAFLSERGVKFED